MLETLGRLARRHSPTANICIAGPDVTEVGRLWRHLQQAFTVPGRAPATPITAFFQASKQKQETMGDTKCLARGAASTRKRTRVFAHSQALTPTAQPQKHPGTGSASGLASPICVPGVSLPQAKEMIIARSHGVFDLKAFTDVFLECKRRLYVNMRVCTHTF